MSAHAEDEGALDAAVTGAAADAVPGTGAGDARGAGAGAAGPEKKKKSRYGRLAANRSVLKVCRIKWRVSIYESVRAICLR